MDRDPDLFSEYCGEAGTDDPDGYVRWLESLVLEDIRRRDEYGTKKYNTRLQPHNGRDYLRDAYDEALDLVVYLRGCMYERDAK